MTRHIAFRTIGDVYAKTESTLQGILHFDWSLDSAGVSESGVSRLIRGSTFGARIRVDSNKGPL